MSHAVDVLSSSEWADRIAADLAARVRAEPALRLCLPTGETPAPVYAALVELAVRGDASLASAEVVLLDEYVGLPEGDPARGGDRLRRELIDRLPSPPAVFHEIDLTTDPDTAAARHDAVAASGLGLTLLGLGLNGHIGLNEPGSTVDSPTRVVQLTATSRGIATDRYGAAASPTSGITLGVARLLESREIWLLVNGERKAEILARALDGPETDAYPASFLRRHPALRVIADEPAASRLA